MGQSIVRVFDSWSRQKAAAHLVAAVVVCAFSGPAQAARVNLGVFHDFGSGIDPALVDIWVGVQNAGNYVRFVIHNDSAITSSVTHVYFESPLGAPLKSGGQNHRENGSTGVSFDFGANPSALPGAGLVGFGGNLTLLGASAKGGKIINGVNDPSIGRIESLTIKIKRKNGTTVADVIEMMKTSGRIGVHVKGVGGDDALRMSLVTGHDDEPDPEPTVVPLPAAVGPGLALLTGFFLRRRRKARG